MDKVFVKMSRTEEVTYREMRDLAERALAGLHELGVRQGDTVVVWLPNTIGCLRVCFGINWLGATYVPINTAYKGGLLEHVLDNAGAEIIVAHADLVGRLAEVDTANLKQVVVFGGEPAAMGNPEVHPVSVLDAEHAKAPILPRSIEPWDVQSIIYTSGTTARPRA